MIKSAIKIFFLVIIAIVFSVIVLLITPINYKGKISDPVVKCWAKIMLMISFIKIKRIGLENILPGGSYIYISNHSSMFDILIALAGIPSDIRFVSKKQLFKIPIFGWAMTMAGYISIDRDRSLKAMRSIEEAAQKIKNGISVILFAEGTRSKDGLIQPFKRGPFLLASKTKVPIIPVTINGASKILPKKSLYLKGGTLEIIFGSPVPTENIKDKNGELALMEKVRNEIIKNYKEV
jgi:1-acyl-sn-glycerol-3-phosphate acyltransferase